jgi:short-subunit dehydrogenase
MNIVVTGASQGIGKGLAAKFAAEGNTVVICSRSTEKLAATKKEIEQAGARVIVKAVDMSKEEAVKAFAKELLEAGIVPDILINNAGTFLPGSLYNEEEGTLQKMIEVNLYSAYHLTRALLPSMMERKRGHIFNICSVASLKAYENGGAYSVSKWALLGFSRNLREEMKPFGIKVTAVCPGATMTASWEGADIDPARIMEVNDVVEMVYAATRLSDKAVVEDIILRPQLGDL